MGNDLAVPYSGYIAGGVHDGTDVELRIRTPFNFNTFSINLCTGRNIDDSDTAFHFNPRYNDNKVVMNHKQGNSWGLEDNENSMPFQRGRLYVIHIIVKEGKFKVKIDNTVFAKFKHRLPIDKIQYLYVEGDIGIEAINFKEKGRGGHHGGQSQHGSGSAAPDFSQPSMSDMMSSRSLMPDVDKMFNTLKSDMFSSASLMADVGPIFNSSDLLLHRPPKPGASQTSSSPSSLPRPTPQRDANRIHNPKVPVSTKIPNKLRSGSVICISGVPSPNCSRFTINLATGPSDSADFALHFDARFNFNNDYGVVVRAHKQRGNFGQEERHQNYFPFVAGSNFDIMILTEIKSYMVAVNNQHFAEFNHRLPFDTVNHVLIKGDVTIKEIRFQ